MQHFNDPGEGIESESEMIADKKECPECDGTGTVCYSCCGDDIKGNDIDLCPTCLEHCSLELEECDRCNGTGEI